MCGLVSQRSRPTSSVPLLCGGIMGERGVLLMEAGKQRGAGGCDNTLPANAMTMGPQMR